MQDLFPPHEYPDLLVGLDSPDDGAVWRLNDDQSLVVTLDFFTPVVDTPYEYGAIAAANALSDLYAMGAHPLFCLNIAAVPVDLPPAIVGEILRGGAEKVRQAGAVIAGGHTVQDKEPKYGLVAIGLVEPGKLMTKGQAKPGDQLVLTKPLGMGVTTTALKNGVCQPEDLERAVAWMSMLNRNAADISVGLGVRAGTDITGFGFLGHAAELASASKVKLRISILDVPFLPGAARYARAGQFPGGTYDNRRFFGSNVFFDETIDETKQMLLFDAQTSGGLLLAIPVDRLGAWLEQARSLGLAAWHVGEVLEGEGIDVDMRSRGSGLPEQPDNDDWTYLD